MDTSFIVLNIALKTGSFAKSFEKIQMWKFATYLRNFKSLKRDVDIYIFTTYRVIQIKNYKMKCGL